jgi:tetratricopeptide (TPR) repeat protein
MSQKRALAGLLILSIIGVGMAIFWSVRAARNTQQAQALALRAQTAAATQEYDQAIILLDQALELAPNEPYLYTLRGQYKLYGYQWDAVLADYNRAIELAPNEAAAYYWRGLLYYTSTAAEDALALVDFERYLALAPNGEHAAQAQTYAAQIRRTRDALNAPLAPLSMPSPVP